MKYIRTVQHKTGSPLVNMGPIRLSQPIPIDEKIAQYGPYVMNTQTEIMEAMLDFQQGKMGFLA